VLLDKAASIRREAHCPHEAIHPSHHSDPPPMPDWVGMTRNQAFRRGRRALRLAAQVANLAQ